MSNTVKKAARTLGAFALVGAVSTPAVAQYQGPSSSHSAYLVPVAGGVATTSLITVGDSVNNKPDGVTPYRMVGIPDGLGAYDNGDRKTFTVLMNHELGATAGVVREHGAKGSFVSKWTVDKKTLRVLKGEDLIQFVASWNPNVGAYNPLAKGVALGRLCSADLAPWSAFLYSPFGAAYDPRYPNPFIRTTGYNGRLFLNGEEVGAEGRAFAHTLDGYTYELPRLGKFSYENSLANPKTRTKTVVVSTDDSTPGQVYVYVGTKTNVGSPVDRAGLTNGSLYGIKVNGIADEPRAGGVPTGTTFSLHAFGNVENQTGAWLQSNSETFGVTEWLRPEDGAWDPRNPNDFYFVTTDRFDTFKNVGTPANQEGRSRLYRLRFYDVNQPELGGVVQQLLNGTEPQQMLDNMCVDSIGRVLVQEDPGNQQYLGKVWEYDIKSGALTLIAEHDPSRFITGAPNFLTQDEESSGIVDISDILGYGYYLADVQAHGVNPPGLTETVEGGQLLVIYDPLKKKSKR